MSDTPQSPSNPTPEAPPPGGRGNNRGGYRPNRRRFNRGGKPQDPSGDPAANGQPGPVNSGGGGKNNQNNQNNQNGQNGQNGQGRRNPQGGQSGQGQNRAGKPRAAQRQDNPAAANDKQARDGQNRGWRKERTLPERDRGPRRGETPPAGTAAENPAGESQSPGNQAQSPGNQAQSPGNQAQSPENRPQQRRGRPPQRGRAQNQNQNQQQNQQPSQPPEGGGQGQRGGGQPQANRRGQAGNNRAGKRFTVRGEAADPSAATRPGGGNRRPAGENRPAAAGNRRAGVNRGEGARKPRKPGPRPTGQPGAENGLDYFKPPPIKTSAGIKARSQEGQYALSWWAARWIAAMENLVDGRRLGRGRSYAKDGQVLSIEEKAGGVVSQVQGSRVKPYRVTIEIIPLSDFEWEKVFDVLASQALFAAQLLAGEMPRNIEEAFDAAGTSLFPARLGDLNTDCSCPDWANPCKHVAATHYILAERFDEDPFLLFRLRGRSSEQILAELRKRRVGAGEESRPEEPLLEELPPPAPLPVQVEPFYHLAAPLDDFALSFKEPAIEMAVLKRLGDPNFLGQESLIANLEGVYRAVRAAALEAALGEAGGEEEETKSNGGADESKP